MDKHFFKTKAEIWAEMKEFDLDQFYLYLKEMGLNPGVPEVHTTDDNRHTRILTPTHTYWERISYWSLDNMKKID